MPYNYQQNPQNPQNPWHPQNPWYPNNMWNGYPTVVPTQQNVQMPVVQQPVQTEQPQGLPAISRVVWVQGREAAKSLQLAPNENVMALDSESDHFYLLRAGQDGKPKPIEDFSFARYEPEEAIMKENYVTRKEFDELKASLDALRSPVNAETKEGE